MKCDAHWAKDARYLLQKQAEQRQRAACLHFSHQLREALHCHDLRQSPEGRVVRRAVRGERQHLPRIPEKKIHQGASGKSVISSNSFLSFSQIVLQILTRGRRKAVYHQETLNAFVCQETCISIRLYLKHWVDGRIADELLPLLTSLSGGQIGSCIAGTFIKVQQS